jgi:hypothetical protein
MISPNSIASYHGQIKGKLEVTQNQKVLSFMLMYNVPMSNRMLHKAMEGLVEIDFGDLKRTTHTLCKKGFIEVAYDKPCEIMQKYPVKYYVIVPIQQTLFK